MGASLPEKSKVAYGQLGASQALNANICSVTTGKGAYTIRGSARHALADGVKLSAGPPGSLVDICILPQAANGIATIPIITIQQLNTTDVVVLRLAVATGASDSASGVLSCQLEQPL